MIVSLYFHMFSLVYSRPFNYLTISTTAAEPMLSKHYKNKTLNPYYLVCFSREVIILLIIDEINEDSYSTDTNQFLNVLLVTVN